MAAPNDGWAVPQASRIKFGQLFHQHTRGLAALTGAQARDILLATGLEPGKLALVWNLSDTNANGQLDVEEFIVAMHLIESARAGIPLPAQLPPNLMPPSKRPPVQHHQPPPPQQQQPMYNPTPVMAPAQPQPLPFDPNQPWLVPPRDIKKHTENFGIVDRAKTGFMTGAQARDVLVRSGLPQDKLAAIWALSDIGTKGKLNVEEYCLAMFLIEKTRAGVPLPSALPYSLVPPCHRAAFIAKHQQQAPEQQYAPPPQQQYGPQPTVPPMGYHGPPPAHPPPPQQQYHAPPPAMPPAPTRMAMAAAASATPPPPMPPAPTSLAMAGVHHQQAGPPPPVPPAPTSGRSSLQSSGSSTPVASSSSADWAVPVASRAKFLKVFEQQDPGRTGFLSGVQARDLLLQAQLPRDRLALIWNLADVDADGRLSSEEFILALHFVEMARSGQPLPNTLPADLIPPSQRPGGGGIVGGAIPPSGPMSRRTSSVSGGAMGLEWAVPKDTKLKYTQAFNQHDRQRQGFLTGVQARGLLVQTGLAHDMLAQVWNLSDVDSNGRLTCEEFVLAMHLCELAKAGEPLPASLPYELVPPSHRRKATRSASVISAGGVLSGPVTEQADIGGEPSSPLSRKGSLSQQVTFEDKRKENFDKGQAVLDRKRQALLDAQRREQEERERKEREEQAKREKVRLEMERKRQEELERQQAKQREIEAEKEEARRKQLEQREAARREMERQRMAEWEAQRTAELQLQKQKVMEALAALRSRKKQVALESESVSKTYSHWSEQLREARAKVAAGKSAIDEMRAERDTKMREQTLVNASLRTLQEKQTYVEREKQKIAAQLKQLAAKDSASATSGSAGGEVTEADAAFALQAKQALIGQLKSQLADVEQEREAKTKDLETSRGQLQELRDTFDKLHARARDLQKEYDALARRGADAKELLYSQSYDPTAADWSSSSAGGGQETSGATSAVATGGTSGGGQYNAIYAYEATRDDELGLQAGDIVEVTPPEAGAEPGWLHGTLPDGRSGWFPSAYVEPVDGGLGQHHGARLESVTEEPAETTSAPLATSGSGVAGDSDSTGEWTIALYAFESQEPGDLNFEVGEKIRITKKDGDWWTGDIDGGARQGIFPSNYVRPLEPGDGPAPTSSSSAVETTIQPTTTTASTTSEQPAWDGGAASVGISEPVPDLPPGPPPSSAAFKEMAATSSPARTASSKGKSGSKSGGKSGKPEIVQVVASYKATGSEQLSLEKGQLIQVRKKNASGWWEGEVQVKGQKKRQIGWFPKTYVKSLSGGGGGSNSGSARSTPDHGAKQQAPAAPVVAAAPSGQQELDDGNGAESMVIAIYPFKAQHEDELSFEASDLIKVITRDDPTWWKGQLVASGAIGLFPSNHVQEHKYVDVGCFEGVEEEEADDIGHHQGHGRFGGAASSANGHRRHSQATDAFEDSSQPSTTSSSPHQNQNENNIPLTSKSPGSSSRPHLLRELLETESAYLSDLRVLVGAFRGPLFGAKALSARESSLVFGNVDQLIALHTQLLESLRSAVHFELDNQSRLKSLSSSSGQLLPPLAGAVLAEHLSQNNSTSSSVCSMSSAYVEFCSRQLGAAKLIERKTREGGYFKERHAHCVSQLLSSSSGSSGSSGSSNIISAMPLSSYLLKPTQRVTRYPLLLARLAAATPLDHPDHVTAARASEAATRLTLAINEGVRKFENSQRLARIQTRLLEDHHLSMSPGDLSEPLLLDSLDHFRETRALRHCGIVVKRASGRQLLAVLFSDLLLLAVPANGDPVLVTSSSPFESFSNIETLFDFSSNFDLSSSSSSENCDRRWRLYRPPLPLLHLQLVTCHSSANGGGQSSNRSSPLDSTHVTSSSTSDSSSWFTIEALPSSSSSSASDRLSIAVKARDPLDAQKWIRAISQARARCLELQEQETEREKSRRANLTFTSSPSSSSSQQSRLLVSLLEVTLPGSMVSSLFVSPSYLPRLYLTLTIFVTREEEEEEVIHEETTAVVRCVSSSSSTLKNSNKRNSSSSSKILSSDTRRHSSSSLSYPSSSSCSSSSTLPASQSSSSLSSSHLIGRLNESKKFLVSLISSSPSPHSPRLRVTVHERRDLAPDRLLGSSSSSSSLCLAQVRKEVMERSAMGIARQPLAKALVLQPIGDHGDQSTTSSASGSQSGGASASSMVLYVRLDLADL